MAKAKKKKAAPKKKKSVAPPPVVEVGREDLTKTTGPRLEMKFEKLSVDKINRAAYNPRKDLQPEDPEYQMLKQAILTHGLVDPLIVNEVNNVLVGGHQRLKILTQEFGVKEVTCSLVHIEDENEEVALNISLNANAGAWEFSKLQNALARFDGLDATDPLRAGLGFTPFQFAEVIDWREKLTQVDAMGETPKDQLPTYQEGAIKQIVLYFDGKDYPAIITRLEKVLAEAKVEDFTSAFLFLLDHYDRTATKENPSV